MNQLLHWGSTNIRRCSRKFGWFRTYAAVHMRSYLQGSRSTWPIGCPETSMTTSLRCVTSQKNGDFNFLNFYCNEKTHNQYHNSICNNSLSVQSTLLHVSTLSFHDQTDYSRCLAKLHTFFKLQLLRIQFIKLRCFTLSFYKFSDCSW